MDPVFELEQQHLTLTHDKLRAIEAHLTGAIEAAWAQARADKGSMLDELGIDLELDVDLETFVELNAMYDIIEGYNQANDVRLRRLANARRLMEQPYFAKVSLQFKPGEPARDLYIGSVGMVDESRRHFIIDWRSPVAEVYYNQSNGPTSYVADGRTINVDLKLRRQFDITGSTLHAYFDTTVAIQDPLLLQSLSQARSSSMRDITATIQKEQNQVIRHEDVDALLVSGIAGSGKTSVLLQRIAYLFYHERDTLRPQDVYLVTPSPMFARYIEDVLPDMGEGNPQTITWDSLMQSLGLGDYGLGKDATAESLHAIDRLLPELKFDARDFNDIVVDGERVVSATQVRNAVARYSKNFAPGTRLAGLVEEELAEKVAARVASRAANEDVHDAVMHLDADEQHRIFGEQIVVQDEQEMRAYAARYLRERYEPALEAIANGQWLRLDRVGMRMLGKEHLTSAEHLYLKMLLVGTAKRHARYVMIDEVQDYTVPQLMVLARYFPHAHFMMLGDANQAIYANTASFAQVREAFERMGRQVSTCQLATSYRSTPEITNLFCSLMGPDDKVTVQSVQPSGDAPVVRVCSTDADYEQALRQALEGMRRCPGLAAIICADTRTRKHLQALLGDDAPCAVTAQGTLPDSGVVMINLPLAKGLEFDEVLIPDAQASVYDGSDLSRRRLYTALSRATKQVTVLANGPLTPLLA